MRAIEFYQNHLDRVSRSFAFCIAKLEGPLRRWVSLTYLVCRILDTVEDAPWKSPRQRQLFLDLEDSLKSPDGVVKLTQSLNLDWPGTLPEGEKKLLQDAHLILEEFHGFPLRVKSVIRDLVQSMSQGMQHFKTGDGLKLAGIKEVNQYCFFVAGVVGEILAKLLVLVEPRASLSERTLVDAHHFGQFLQKVNLLKDQIQDEKEGRFLVPSRIELFSSLKENSEGAFRYIESLPFEQKGYRLFCAWSFYLGLASLPFAEESYRTGLPVKIGREKTLSLLAHVESIIESPEGLRSLFEMLKPQHLWSQPLLAVNERGDSTWVGRVYKGSLTEKNLRALGL